MDDPDRYDRATFSAGCFWDVEAAFRQVDGVIETIAGYTGGHIPDPTYEMVESGRTGHVEAVGILFNPAIISYDRLLELFWNCLDPSKGDGGEINEKSRQRVVIFFHDNDQKEAALTMFNTRKLPGPVRVLPEVLPASVFWPAEECHQRFYEKCGQGYCTTRQLDE